MRQTSVLSVIVLAAVACLAPSAQAAPADTGSTTAVASFPAQAPQVPVTAQPAVNVAPPSGARCEGVPERAPLACSFGAPRCSYAGQCASWCYPLAGLCLSGCCACQI
jgi:hypothetical protein